MDRYTKKIIAARQRAIPLSLRLKKNIKNFFLLMIEPFIFLFEVIVKLLPFFSIGIKWILIGAGILIIFRSDFSSFSRIVVLVLLCTYWIYHVIEKTKNEIVNSLKEEIDYLSQEIEALKDNTSRRE